MFYMEDYELFGAKTKNIDFQFMDYVAVQEYDLTKEIEGQELFYQKLYDITDQLLHLTDNHVLSGITANDPPDTDMEQVLAEMKKYMAIRLRNWSRTNSNWDTFTQNARMQWVLWQNGKDQKRVMFFGSHAGICRTLYEQISGQQKESFT